MANPQMQAAPNRPTIGRGAYRSTTFTILSVLFAAGLCWLYDREITVYWGYFYFTGSFSLVKFVIAASITAIVSISAPKDLTARSILICAVHFLFIIPSIIYAVAIEAGPTHWICLLYLFVCVYFLSAVRVPTFGLHSIDQRVMIMTLLAVVLGLVALQIIYGGLSTFNLDITRVYEFRRDAEAGLPAIFQYLYSNLSNALLPILALLAVKNRRFGICALAIFASVLLFGMTHHKSVLFGTVFAVLLYLFLNWRGSILFQGLVLSSIVTISIAEILWKLNISQMRGPSVFTELMIRRVMLVPGMLDGLHIDFFQKEGYLWWRNSRLGEALGLDASSLSAPEMIGMIYFGTSSLVANAGIIGSGFSNGGLAGLAIYGIFAAVILSMLNEYGKNIGHTFVASASLAIYFAIIASADLLTMFFTHGLALMIAVLSLIGRDKTWDSLLDSRVRSRF